MIEFPPEYPEEKLLKQAVRWSFRNRHHIPSLSELFPRRSVEELTDLGRKWQASELGFMIEFSNGGRRSVSFSLNDQAVAVVRQMDEGSLIGQAKSVGWSDWIAFAALIVSVFALVKPGS